MFNFSRMYSRGVVWHLVIASYFTRELVHMLLSHRITSHSHILHLVTSHGSQQLTFHKIFARPFTCFLPCFPRVILGAASKPCPTSRLDVQDLLDGRMLQTFISFSRLYVLSPLVFTLSQKSSQHQQIFHTGRRHKLPMTKADWR
jgi:hypothetical protein